jgi:hypothetical protein
MPPACNRFRDASRTLEALQEHMGWSTRQALFLSNADMETCGLQAALNLEFDSNSLLVFAVQTEKMLWLLVFGMVNRHSITEHDAAFRFKITHTQCRRIGQANVETPIVVVLVRRVSCAVLTYSCLEVCRVAMAWLVIGQSLSDSGT